MGAKLAAALLMETDRLRAQVAQMQAPVTQMQAPVTQMEASLPEAFTVQRRSLLRVGCQLDSAQSGCLERNQLVLVEAQHTVGGRIRCKVCYPR